MLIPVLLAAALVPAPAASPPPGDDFYTAAQLVRGLPAAADLPGGYAEVGGDSGQVMEFPVFGSDLCRESGMPDTIWGPLTTATRSFRGPAGGTLSVSLTAVGSVRAAGIVESVRAAPSACPDRQSALALPDVGLPSAGIVSAAGAERTQAVVLSYGNVSAVFTGGGEGFVAAVVRAAGRVARVDDPPPVEVLARGLIDVEDLPAGHRVVPADSASFFGERDCDGNLRRFGGKAVARRTFAAGEGYPAVRAAVGAFRGHDLVEAVRTRLRECPGQTVPFPVPATDIPVAGVDDGTVVRVLIAYRDVCSELRVTRSRTIGTAEISAMVAAALRKGFDVG